MSTSIYALGFSAFFYSHQLTQSTRTIDHKGRHTTTARTLHALTAGGLLIDTPGLRELQLALCEPGIDQLFLDIQALTLTCRFNNGHHQTEPGCAVLDALESGALLPKRWQRYQKLKQEDFYNSVAVHEKRQRERHQGQCYKTTQRAKRHVKKINSQKRCDFF